MNNKFTTRFFAIFLALLCAFPWGFQTALTTSGSSGAVYAADEIDVEAYQKKLDELMKKIESLEDNANEYKQLAKLISGQVSALDSQIAKLSDEIEECEKKIAQAQKRLDDTIEELEEAEADRAIYQKKFEERLSVLYKYGNSGYIEVLFGSTSFSDFIGRVQSISYIITYDTAIADELKALEETITAKKLQIEAEKEIIETEQTDILAKQGTLEIQMADKKAELASAKKNQTYYNALIKQEEEDAEEIRRIIASVNGEGQYKNDFDAMLWPTPGYTSITDKYGYRIHPIYGVKRFHYGIDIGAPGGKKIVAPGNGVVSTSTYNSSYGNYVILNLGKTAEGKTITMVFAHMRKRAVAKGDKVDVGDILGYVGTTGASTGNHLHFEIRVNGSTVNPLSNSYVKVIKK